MIVIPMAGRSSRFTNAGYSKPKFMLEAFGKTLFEYSVGSFEKYFSTEEFLFIIRDDITINDFVLKSVKKLGISNFHVVLLDHDTRGQAETVYLGFQGLFKREIKGLETRSLTIFNIDTFRPSFSFPDLNKYGDGYLEVFKGAGENWSFAKPQFEGSTLVSETSEKRPISNLCSTGLYHFGKVKDYVDSFLHYSNLPSNAWEKGELYIAPLFNHLIKSGLQIHYHEINKKDVIFCGTPDEYIYLLETKKTVY